MTSPLPTELRAAEIAAERERQWRVVRSDEDSLKGLVSDGEVTHWFHLTSFHAAPRRWPVVGELVSVEFTNHGDVLAVFSASMESA